MTLDKSISGRGHYRKFLPRVFTEQGIYMLATILKSKIATEVTLNIMDTFVLIKKYVSNSLIEQTYINTIVLENYYEINEIKNNVKSLTESFNKLDDKKKETEIYFHGQMFDAYYKKNNLLTKQDIDKYNLEYSNLRVIYSNNFHDRYFILDNSIFYHCGTSINRIGYKTFSITLMGDKFACDNLFNHVNRIISKQL